MNKNRALAIALPVSAVLVAGIIANAVSPSASDGPHITCHAEQPVFPKNPDAGPVGTWQAVLQPGQSVTLPDGDTYTCTMHGAEVH